ncbi:hypothetical protein RvY_12590-2 [Ramazzottius varieornatus]|uniref:Uncharacterized protein n=1 Tax=Ramazzottius varieornatus TaxID=947166 RepID=A0A1D1VK30_RAMVA|nr:hypothetical protein RvY_12590-2 [Ramazzottius varieornatus]
MPDQNTDKKEGSFLSEPLSNVSTFGFESAHLPHALHSVDSSQAQVSSSPEKARETSPCRRRKELSRRERACLKLEVAESLGALVRTVAVLLDSAIAENLAELEI